MKSKTGWTRAWLVLVVGAMCLAFTLNISAQVKTETTTERGQAVQEATVERGEVVLVSGNDLVVKMENGEIRHFANVPESARATVDGQELGIHDLKPGMKLQRTLTVTTTPKTITTVQTVTARFGTSIRQTLSSSRLRTGPTSSSRFPRARNLQWMDRKRTLLASRRG